MHLHIQEHLERQLTYHIHTTLPFCLTKIRIRGLPDMLVQGQAPMIAFQASSPHLGRPPRAYCATNPQGFDWICM
jgi:DMSO reductase anchor subunit